MTKNRRNLFIKSLFFYTLSTLAICFPLLDVAHVVAVNILSLLLNIFLISFKKLLINVKKVVCFSVFLVLAVLFVLYTTINWMTYLSSPDFFTGSIIRSDNYNQIKEITHYIEEKEKVGFNVIIC